MGETRLSNPGHTFIAEATFLAKSDPHRKSFENWQGKIRRRRVASIFYGEASAQATMCLDVHMQGVAIESQCLSRRRDYYYGRLWN